MAQARAGGHACSIWMPGWTAVIGSQTFRGGRSRAAATRTLLGMGVGPTGPLANFRTSLMDLQNMPANCKARDDDDNDHERYPHIWQRW
jgi:hypothetical protein